MNPQTFILGLFIISIVILQVASILFILIFGNENKISNRLQKNKGRQIR